ncbi:hypothetical protein SAMN02745945_02956 [Peptoclostridium litorale DSM 5388]|uniref:Uncharacterized protein n=1 Tax=Peptoclostridium litorale DSM 5388 TaxID=1121324 RepID=A0A069RIG7_PEPLI|nr:hypothetical protein [Peptoclostridium litorale]KDR96816.1 hypothetical protein CLIT_20p00290 [Peptoclostridium litorale DSM 5388]SIO36494.1 hypothetical protein SAMN02745945_02956 [Peptoclostridium litorale DSM 5388]
MDFKFESISEEEFEKRKNDGEFGEVSSVIESDDSASMLKEQDTEETKEKKEYVRQTFLIDPDLKLAIKRKAANEDRGINEIVREILRNGIEDKYFRKY